MYNKIINITLSIIDEILVPKRIKVIGLYFFSLCFGNSQVINDVCGTVTSLAT